MAMYGGTEKLVYTGYMNGNSSRPIKVYVYYTISQNTVNNQSIINCGMKVTTPGASYDIGAWQDVYGSYVGNTSLTFNGYIPNFGGERWIAENKSFIVRHNSDGSGTATIYWKWGVNSSWGRIQNPSGSFTITLPTIARASSISNASSIILGNSCNIKWTPASSGFRYYLKFVLGSWNYETPWIYPNRTSAYTYTGYTIPLTVANQITNTTTGTMAVYLYTYNGNTQIGSTASRTFTVTIPQSVKPIVNYVSATIDNSDNQVIDAWGIAVAGYTKVKIDAEASGSYGSTINNFVISGGYSISQTGSSLSYKGEPVYSSGNKKFTIVAKDSRNRSSDSKTTSGIMFHPYSKPLITEFSVARDENDATKIVVKVNWNYSSVDNKNSAKCSFYYKESTATNWSKYENDIERNISIIIPNFSEFHSYNFKAIVTDELSSSEPEERFISTIDVLLDFRAGGKGMGIGKVAETDNLEIAVDTIFSGDIFIKNDNENILLKEFIRNIIGDYIIEHDSDDIWEYRKWNSGIAECWGKVNFKINLTNAGEGVYYTSGETTFPLQFIKEPLVVGSCPWNYANWVNVFPNNTDYSKCSWLYYQTNSNGNGEIRSVYIYAKGRWK